MFQIMMKHSFLYVTILGVLNAEINGNEKENIFLKMNQWPLMSTNNDENSFLESFQSRFSEKQNILLRNEKNRTNHLDKRENIIKIFLKKSNLKTSNFMSNVIEGDKNEIKLSELKRLYSILWREVRLAH